MEQNWTTTDEICCLKLICTAMRDESEGSCVTGLQHTVEVLNVALCQMFFQDFLVYVLVMWRADIWWSNCKVKHWPVTFRALVLWALYELSCVWTRSFSYRSITSIDLSQTVSGVFLHVLFVACINTEVSMYEYGVAERLNLLII